ncbi:hypothetical protein WR25_09487 [Diploscapter pachys]|uniref:Histone H2A/H2B/H3 domain-containing protein n=1 Tax=Diploscapter pachys TaxID=2018661 RepID=A0A2A2JRX8_9BILA|nr:hypothetical protein WR25_09487 [Diploscapter pachys]
MAVLKKAVTATGSGDKNKSKKSVSGGVKIEDKKKRKQIFLTSGDNQRNDFLEFTNELQVHPNITISGKVMTIINSMMKDVYERVVAEAAKLSNYGKKSTHSA